MRTLELEGSPRERGRQHGEALRDEIAEALERWSELVSERGTDPLARISAIAERSPYPATIQARCPELLEEVRGIAEGSGTSFAEVLLLNLMDEEWWFRDGEESGCSLFAARLPEEHGGAPFLAQNMDLPAWMDGLQTILRIRAAGEGPDTERVVLSAAGMIGLTGMRRGGVAIGVNTLLQLPRSQRGLPVAFVLRSALEQPTAAAAAGYLAALPHASGQHYAVVDDHEIFGLECSARGAALRRFDGGDPLVHTNHPLWTDSDSIVPPESVGIVGIRLQSSHRRLEALAALADPGADADQARIRAALADRSTGVCMTASPEYPTLTFGSVELSPNADVVRMLPGNHGETEWVDCVTASADRVAAGEKKGTVGS